MSARKKRWICFFIVLIIIIIIAVVIGIQVAQGNIGNIGKKNDSPATATVSVTTTANAASSSAAVSSARQSG
jgi:syntaxin 1B/2/3